MSWTVACFCGTVFESPTDRCPTCHTPLPEVTRAADAAESVQLPDDRHRHSVREMQPGRRQNSRTASLNSRGRSRLLT